MGSFPKQMLVANFATAHRDSVLQCVSALTELDELLFFVCVYQGIHESYHNYILIVEGAQPTLD